MALCKQAGSQALFFLLQAGFFVISTAGRYLWLKLNQGAKIDALWRNLRTPCGRNDRMAAAF